MVRSLYKMLLLAAVLLAAHADEDIEVEEVEGAERQLPSMLLYKKLTPSADFTVMSPINVTLTVFNKGPGKAHQIIVADDNWKSDKFIVVAGDNNFTLEYLEAGDSYSHDFTVKPIRKLYHRVRPAKMLYVLSPPSDAETLSLDGLTTHLSNSIGEMRVTPPKDNLEENLLLVGRVLTLNVIQTKSGWTVAAVLALIAIGAQLYFVGSTVMQKRRHLRALEDIKKL
uniref:Translocon-associated protein subunit beta n=2 Tax=Chrysotila carterae TaxID=13221 RepID=A0A7S4BJE8_CHRCT